jgi:hypothetical protein
MFFSGCVDGVYDPELIFTKVCKKSADNKNSASYRFFLSVKRSFMINPISSQMNNVVPQTAVSQKAAKAPEQTPLVGSDSENSINEKSAPKAEEFSETPNLKSEEALRAIANQESTQNQQTTGLSAVTRQAASIAYKLSI